MKTEFDKRQRGEGLQLALVDSNLPGLIDRCAGPSSNGRTADFGSILELRAHSPGIRIIAMTGGGEKKRLEVLGHAKLLGAVLTLEKPFAQAELMATVDRALKGGE